MQSHLSIFSLYFITTSDSKKSKNNSGVYVQYISIHDGESQGYYPSAWEGQGDLPSVLRSGTTITNDTASCARQWEDPAPAQPVLQQMIDHMVMKLGQLGHQC